MSNARYSDPADAQACGCGVGVQASTPQVIHNRPGLSALAARVGDYHGWRQTMLARLNKSKDGTPTALSGLTTRDVGDFSIGLLDAWACVGDVLSFYQERIANESYLGTATERLSVVEMARLVGYRPGPGVAASAYLAFTVEAPPGVTRRVAATRSEPSPHVQNATQLGVPQVTRLDAGVKVQSIPAPGETAQVYETVDAIEARAEWNAIRPRLTQRQTVTAQATELFLEGQATGLRKGDYLLTRPDGGDKLRLHQVAEVELDEYWKCTRVRLCAGIDAGSLGKVQAFPMVSSGAAAVQTVNPILARILAVPQGNSTGLRMSQLRSMAEALRLVPADVLDHLREARLTTGTVTVYRCRAAAFGNNAPLLAQAQKLYPGFYAKVPSRSQARAAGTNPSEYWDEELEGKTLLNLESSYPTITAGSFITLVCPDATVTALTTKVSSVRENSLNLFTLSGRVTSLVLNAPVPSGYTIRNTTVLGESVSLPLARAPYEIGHDEVSGDEIDLEDLIEGLKAGQKIVVSGELADEAGVTVSEIAELAEEPTLHAADGDPFMRIRLADKLQRKYVRRTVTINANVALATHGERVATFGAAGEVLGSGNAAQTFQSFVLAQQPLTQLSTGTASGLRSTLGVRVQGVLWTEVPSLIGCGPHDRVYMTRQAEDGRTQVMFGDGVRGARLPTGASNVVATYRRGLGSAGRVAAHQLTQLLSRPLGLKSVTNPLPADGGADPQSLEQARRCLPRPTLALGRVVSLKDVQDFASAFAGIGKASADRKIVEGKPRIVVTVAGEGGRELAATGGVIDALKEAILGAADLTVPLDVEPFVLRRFGLTVGVAVSPERTWADVEAAIIESLNVAFSFERRQFGQKVLQTEVIAAIQAVVGVEACVVEALRVLTESIPEGGLTLPLRAGQPLLAEPSDLLLLDASAVTILAIEPASGRPTSLPEFRVLPRPKAPFSKSHLAGGFK